MPQVLYPYEKLSQSAKDKALSEYFSDFDDSDMITELMKDELTQNGYDPELIDLSWSLSYAQGDGVSLKGAVCASDLPKLVKRFFPRNPLKLYQVERLIEEDFYEAIKFRRVYGYRTISVDTDRINYHNGIAKEEVEYKLSQWDDEEVLTFFQDLPEDDRYVRFQQSNNCVASSQWHNFEEWLKENDIADYFWKENKFFAFIGNAVMAVEMEIPSKFLDSSEWHWATYLAETPDEMREALKEFYITKIGDEIDSVADSLLSEIAEAIAEDVEELEKKLQKLGYEEIEYQTSEEMLIEKAKDYGWLFDERGNRIES